MMLDSINCNMISKRYGRMLVIGSNPSLPLLNIVINPQWFNIYKESLVKTISKTNNPQTELYLSIDKKYEILQKKKIGIISQQDLISVKKQYVSSKHLENLFILIKRT